MGKLSAAGTGSPQQGFGEPLPSARRGRGTAFRISLGGTARDASH